MAVLYALSVLAWCAVARRFGTAAAVADRRRAAPVPGLRDALPPALDGLALRGGVRVHGRPRRARGGAADGGPLGRARRAPWRRSSSCGRRARRCSCSCSCRCSRAAAPACALVRAAAFAAAAALPLLAWAVAQRRSASTTSPSRAAAARRSRSSARSFATGSCRPTTGLPRASSLGRWRTTCSSASRTGRTASRSTSSSGTAAAGCTRTSSASTTERGAGTTTTAISPPPAREAVRAHPWTYARNVARDFGIVLRAPLLLDVPAPSGSAQPAPAAAPETIVVNGRRLPKPSEGDLIPAAHQAGLVSTPDGSIEEVWTSPTEHHLVVPRPGRRAARARARRADARARHVVPGPRRQRDARAGAQHRLARSTREPCSCSSSASSRSSCGGQHGWPTPAVLAGAGLLVAGVTMLGVYAVPEYVVPVTPAFVLLAAAGLVGERATRSPSRVPATASVGDARA